KWLRFIVDETDQPQLGVAQIEPVPCFEDVLNPFSLDQCARKHRPKLFWPRTRLEAFRIHSAREIKQFFLRKTAHAKSLGCLVGQDQQDISEFVLLYEPPPLEQ